MRRLWVRHQCGSHTTLASASGGRWSLTVCRRPARRSLGWVATSSWSQDLRGRLGGLQPQVLAHEPERHGVLTLLELHVGVAMGLDLRPHGELRRTIRQPLQQVPFGLFQSRQWPLVGAAVDALTGFAEYPGAQLPVVIAQIAKLPQRHEALLDVLDARLDAALRPKAHGPSAWVPPSCR